MGNQDTGRILEGRKQPGRFVLGCLRVQGGTFGWALLGTPTLNVSTPKLVSDAWLDLEPWDLSRGGNDVSSEN